MSLLKQWLQFCRFATLTNYLVATDEGLLIEFVCSLSKPGTRFGGELATERGKMCMLITNISLMVMGPQIFVRFVVRKTLSWRKAVCSKYN